MANDNSTKKPLSASAINALKAGDSLTDSGEYAGLNISCQQSGVKTFFYRFRSPITQKTKRVPIGTFIKSIQDESLDPILGEKLLGLASARQILTTLKAQRKSGICPRMQLDQEIADIKVQRRSLLHNENRLSIKDVVEVYLTQHIEDHTNSNGRVISGVRKIKGQKETRRTLAAVVGKIEPTEFGALPAEDIKHTNIKNLIFGIIDKGTKVQAGRVLNELNLSYNFCIGRPNTNGDYYLPEELINPCLQAKEFFKNQRTKLTPTQGKRTLDDTELQKFLVWLPDSSFSPLSKNILMLTLLTGVRSGEATNAEKEHFDLKKGTWHLSDTKTEVERYVQLSVQTIDYIRPILENLRNTTPYLFPAGTTTKPQMQKQLSQQAYHLKKNDNMLEIPAWTAHDLRRTVRTQLSRLGCPSDIGEAILGHSKKGIEGVYNLHRYENECAVWLQKWADHLDMLMNKIPNVISISKSA